MNKWLMALILGCATITLAACGSGDSDASTDKDGQAQQAEESGDAAGAKNDSKEEAKGDDTFSKEYNEVIADNENIKATLRKAEHIIDKEWDEEKFVVTFEVENKREDTLEFQANEVSADGKMIDDSMLSMSQEVSGGKRADAVLTIENYEGDLPSLEDNIEMLLHIFSWDDMDYSEDHAVTIDLK
ncbi:hypothetical protein [Edaphobacillus lindanitolerans]|uniref:DUF4352 domain-containing protein n=1 Tax=Edaphobacillus lindanitolerans TaxID=550447 RepID=A0A1U7PLG3_9BACI|nr:hypothetical protein [Edaphobacillus lindanitolerans]SIT73913.1 hypothetical protein SAMN05428946_1031 [Edaphobacillus lindanitolerans]